MRVRTFIELSMDLDKTKPSEGKRVRIAGGMKLQHRGKVGTVLRHRENHGLTYLPDHRLMMMYMTGIEGFDVLVDTGSERFWVKAQDVLVIE